MNSRYYEFIKDFCKYNSFGFLVHFELIILYNKEMCSAAILRNVQREDRGRENRKYGLT